MSVPTPPATSANNAAAESTTLEDAVQRAKRAFALKQYEQAVDHYATALELMTAAHGDGAPEAADLYFSYGKALLEHAVAQSAVLGREQAEDAPGPAEGAPDAFLSFSGDAEEEDADADADADGESDGEEGAVDLFAAAAAAVEDAEREEAAEGAGEDGEGDGDGEPEDDFNAAWEVLDLARALYERQQDGDDEVRLKLADTYIALGDVSLETEKFDQAIADYTTGAEIKSTLLPLSSRQVAEAHYKLSMVLDLTAGRLGDAITHAEQALASVEARLAELRVGLSGQLPTVPSEDPKKHDAKGKGKGKAAATKLVRDELVQNMSRTQIAAEVKELEGLHEDLALKVEELKTSPADAAESAPVRAAKALDRDLNVAGASGTAGSTVVNDLTAMVVKKKKKASDVNGAATNGSNGSAKRKADDDADEPSTSEKKVKVGEE